MSYPNADEKIDCCCCRSARLNLIRLSVLRGHLLAVCARIRCIVLACVVVNCARPYSERTFSFDGHNFLHSSEHPWRQCFLSAVLHVQDCSGTQTLSFSDLVPDSNIAYNSISSNFQRHLFFHSFPWRASQSWHIRSYF